MPKKPRNTPKTVDDLPYTGQPNGDVSKEDHKMVQDDPPEKRKTGDRNTDLLHHG